MAPFLSLLLVTFFFVPVLTHPLIIPSDLLILPDEQSSSPNGTLTRPKPKPKPPQPPPSPEPPWDSVHCITNSRLFPVSERLCGQALAELYYSDTSTDPKTYSEPLTRFGAGGCHIDLKKTTGQSKITITDKDIAGYAITVMKECEVKNGAGWVQLVDGQPWYLLVYGEKI